MKCVLAIAAALALYSSAPAQGTFVEDSLYSPALHRMKHLRVSLPPAGAKKFPAMLLLHGYTGNYTNWFDLTRAAEIARSESVIVVSTDGENSWYVNSLTDSSERFEEYFTRDVIPFLLKKYPIDGRRLGIAGLSMGGYGSLVLGLRHPEIFRFIGAMSGSLDVPFLIPDLEKNGRAGLRASLEKTFGSDTSRWAGLAPERLLAAVDTSSAPYLYLCNGIQDQFIGRLALYRRLADIARSRGFRYEYHETPGTHSMEYWGREIAPLLARFRDIERDSSR